MDEGIEPNIDIDHELNGDTGLPLLLGLIGLLPCIAGLLVVILLWKTPKTHTFDKYKKSKKHIRYGL